MTPGRFKLTQDLLTAVQKQQPRVVLASFSRFVKHVKQADVATVDATLNALVKSIRQVETMPISWTSHHQDMTNRFFMGFYLQIQEKLVVQSWSRGVLWDLQAIWSNLGHVETWPDVSSTDESTYWHFAMFLGTGDSILALFGHQLFDF